MNDTVKTDKLLDELEEEDFEGIEGEISFDDTQEVYIGFPTEMLSGLMTSIGHLEGRLDTSDKLEVLAIDVRGDMSIALVTKKIERNLN